MSSRRIQIAYDHQIFSFQAYGGVSRYICEIARRIDGFSEFDVRVLCPLFVNRYLAEARTLKVWGRRTMELPKGDRVLLRLNESLVRWKLGHLRPDLVHETYYSARRSASGKSRTVITVHDMIHEKFPQYFSSSDVTRRSKRAAVDHADHILCVSENTRTDLVNIFGVKPERTSVIHLAHTPLPEGREAPTPRIDRPYLAYVGARSRYKNFSGFLRAFGSSEKLRKDFAIVCFGGGSLTSEEKVEVARLQLPERSIVHVEGNDEALAGVYRGATALVYPSLYEGFGLPPLEAMSCKCPLVASNTGSLPEVCGSAAEYFDPSDQESIVAALERVATSESRRQELIEQGSRRVAGFSWDKCAAETSAVYQKVVHG